MNDFLRTYYALYNMYTNNNLQYKSSPKNNRKVVSTITSVGNVYSFTKEDYVSCVHYCYTQNPLNLPDIKLYGAINTFIRVIPIYAMNGKPKTFVNEPSQCNDDWVNAFDK
jgi:hypothetical protein